MLTDKETLFKKGPSISLTKNNFLNGTKVRMTHFVISVELNAADIVIREYEFFEHYVFCKAAAFKKICIFTFFRRTQCSPRFFSTPACAFHP